MIPQQVHVITCRCPSKHPVWTVQRACCFSCAAPWLLPVGMRSNAYGGHSRDLAIVLRAFTICTRGAMFLLVNIRHRAAKRGCNSGYCLPASLVAFFLNFLPLTAVSYLQRHQQHPQSTPKKCKKYPKVAGSVYVCLSHISRLLTRSQAGVADKRGSCSVQLALSLCA
jgi:hypothetical protein